MQLSSARCGSGTPLLLIHGIGHRRQAWDPVLDRLAEHHDVIAVDLPGFGQSPPPPSDVPYTMAAAVELLSQACAELGVDRPHVAGNSLGGALALEMAVAGLAASATALSPAGFYTTAERRWALGTLGVDRFLVRATPRPVLRLVARSTLLRTLAMNTVVARPARLSAERAYGDMLALRNAPGYAAVARAAMHYRFRGIPQVPVTVAWGTRDRILLPRQADRARAALPAARHVPLPGCGHVPMSDDPDLVAQVILDTAARATTEAAEVADSAEPPQPRAAGA